MIINIRRTTSGRAGPVTIKIGNKENKNTEILYVFNLI